MEEFFYRKLIIGHIFKNYEIIGLIVSSLLFGFAHMGINEVNPFGFLSYYFMGLLYGLVYYKTKRIEAAILAHSINNFIMTTLTLLVI